MSRLVDRVQAFALALGAPGLFLVAFLDSSILSLPEIADLLVIWMVTQHKPRMIVYVLSATLGSISGCMTLYFIGKKGGEALIRSRFNSASVDRALASFRRYGIMAVLIPAILPPPAPFKIFVLLAGVAGISPARFALSVAIGRGARYFSEGLLAIWYGDQALEFMHDNAATVSIVVVALLASGLVGYVVWRKVDARRGR